jgi:hypothetical protein
VIGINFLPRVVSQFAFSLRIHTRKAGQGKAITTAGTVGTVVPCLGIVTKGKKHMHAENNGL